jgi:Flp pilus assembly protein TadG
MYSRANFMILFVCALKRLRRDRDGASAVEFALVGPLMFMAVFGVLEIGLGFMATQYLETATQQSTRLIMTGQVKSSSLSKEQFKQLVCDRVKLMIDCANLYVDAQKYDSFSEADFSDPVANGKFVDNTKFITGKQGDIVVVRTFYKWPVLLANFYGFDQSNLEGGKRLISASAAVRNEPW